MMQMQLTEKFKQIKDLYGEWSAHNIKLDSNISTMDDGIGERYIERANIYKVFIQSELNKKLSRLKVLDLGCLEGGISIELAKEGACCTGIDVRDSHLVKARFASDVLGLKKRCKWINADVTSSNAWQKTTRYDVIILSGLLYHLDIKDILPFLKRLRSNCSKKSMMIVDTNITSKYLNSYMLNENLTVWGRNWKEHKTDDTYEDRLSRGWSSMSNNTAFWLTERSLVNMLVSADFGFVYKPLYPYHEWGHKNRDIWIAKPGSASKMDYPLRSDPDIRATEHPGFQ